MINKWSLLVLIFNPQCTIIPESPSEPAKRTIEKKDHVSMLMPHHLVTSILFLAWVGHCFKDLNNYTKSDCFVIPNNHPLVYKRIFWWNCLHCCISIAKSITLWVLISFEGKSLPVVHKSMQVSVTISDEKNMMEQQSNDIWKDVLQFGNLLITEK